MSDRIVAVGLLTEQDISVLGIGFRRLFPLSGSGEFDDLIQAIDRADRSYQPRPPAPVVG